LFFDHVLISTTVFLDVTEDVQRVAIVEEGLNANEARGRLPMWNTDRARHSLWRIVEDTVMVQLVV
jgi:hypothetical protein